MQHRFAAALAALALALSGSALAQGWPNKAIKWVNPFPAGGGTDAFARPLAAKLTASLGQTVFIENLGGAGGTVGAGSAAKAAPDGYTFFVGAIHHTIAETLYSKLPYSGIEKDFEPVTVIAYVPNVVSVHPKHDFKTLADLIAYAKANPGKLNFGSAGNGTSHHLVGELFKNLTGTSLTHVPYRGAGPLMQDLLAGNVDLAFDGMGTSGPQITAGKLKALAVTSESRSPVIPNVPTMIESGFPTVKVTTWYGVWAIKGTPKEIVDRMHAELVKAMAMPDVKDIWAKQGATAGGQSPAEFARFIRGEIETWGKVVKQANLKVDL